MSDKCSSLTATCMPVISRITIPTQTLSITDVFDAGVRGTSVLSGLKYISYFLVQIVSISIINTTTVNDSTRLGAVSHEKYDFHFYFLNYSGKSEPSGSPYTPPGFLSIPYPGYPPPPHLVSLKKIF